MLVTVPSMSDITHYHNTIAMPVDISRPEPRVPMLRLILRIQSQSHAAAISRFGNRICEYAYDVNSFDSFNS